MSTNETIKTKEELLKKLTPSQREIILASLDHSEEHLFAAYEAGYITLDTFNLRLLKSYQQLKNNIL
jgi:hypothetical protein